MTMTTIQTAAAVFAVLRCIASCNAFAFSSNVAGPRKRNVYRCGGDGRPLGVSAGGGPEILGLAASQTWGVEDDWNRLTSEGESSGGTTNPSYSADAADPVETMARAMEVQMRAEQIRNSVGKKEGESVPKAYGSEEEMRFVEDTVESILYGMGDPSVDPPLYDTESSLEKFAMSDEAADRASTEISMLVRCNESPETLLISEGRAVKALTDEERYDLSQLVTIHEGRGGQGKKEEKSDDMVPSIEPTEFFKRAIAQIFNEHCVIDPTSQKPVLDRGGLSRWMSKSLAGRASEEDEGAATSSRPTAPLVGKHDKRIGAVVSRYSTYGTGYLQLPEFQQLYFDAVKAGLRKNVPRKPMGEAMVRSLRLKQPTIESVWRDFTSHGILSPVEQEREDVKRKLEEQFGTMNDSRATSSSGSTASVGGGNLMDECEILGWEEDNASPDWKIDSSGSGSKQRKMSHERVELASDGKTPKRLKDGQFVFIDEESCIGCTQCAVISPNSFVMLENGRARTLQQRNAQDVPIAVSACPVNCMHPVSFDELKEMETARDVGDGRDDHRHMSRAAEHTPLFVAGIGSDNNHKSSWYHYLRHKCYMSKNCPQRGCYDCPNFSTKGSNPFFKKKHRKAQRIRAREFIDSGEADIWRKTAQL